MPEFWETVYREATEYLQQFLRIDTTNPPGNERAAVQWLAQILKREGLAPTIVESAPSRANLVCRLPATGPTVGGPLLLTSHLDVVPAEAAQWTHPPFGGVIADGYIWGRGALDMKSKTIMDLMTILIAKRERWPLRRDCLLAAVADEEAGCRCGSQYLVEHHPDLIRAEYALNEAGGYTTHVNGHRIYPIQVAEKGVAWLRLTFHGTPGHGSRPHNDMAMAKMGRAVARLASRRFPMHVTPAAVMSAHVIAETSPPLHKWLLRGMTQPWIGQWFEQMLPRTSPMAFLSATLRNTACPTVVHGGQIQSGNVIPSTVTLHLDGRIVPGQTLEDLLAELRDCIGEHFTIETPLYLPPTTQRYDTPLFETIRTVVEQADPGATVTPFLLGGFTDAHFYKKLGTTTYGFQPILCPEGYDLVAQYHAHDERIPVAGFHWGVRTFTEVVRRFCG